MSKLTGGRGDVWCGMVRGLPSSMTLTVMCSEQPAIFDTLMMMMMMMHIQNLVEKNHF
jgi:hypothetical protein